MSKSNFRLRVELPKTSDSLLTVCKTVSPVEAHIGAEKAQDPRPHGVPGERCEAEVLVHETVHDDLDASNLYPI